MAVPEEQREPTLYRKYRPQTFADVSGQNHIVEILQRACEEDRLAHAYLFAGPRGTGKTTVARLLAKRINCMAPKRGEPCGRCASCVSVAAGAHLDLIEIDAASNRGIDDIRALKERITLQPVSGKTKVYIVDEVHMLSKDAFNALLKTLEEPPTHALFVLATTELEKVPETIRSRCQIFLFRRAPAALIVERLQRIARAEGIAVTRDALHLLAVSSGGCFRDAETLLAHVAGSAERALTVEDVSRLLGLPPIPLVQDFVEALIEKDAARALGILRDASERGMSFVALTETLARTLRALAATAIAGTHAEPLAPEEEERLKRLARATAPASTAELLRRALRAKYELRDAVYQELPLELLVLEWCGERVPERVENRESGTPRARATAPVAEQRAPAAREAEDPPGKPNSPLPLERVIEAWPAFLRAAAQLHPLLRPMLRDTVPLAVRDGTLFVLSAHALAHDRFKDAKFRHAVEERLEVAVGEKLALRVVRPRDLKQLDLPEPTADLSSRLAAAADVEPTVPLTDAIELFGGEVVSPNARSARDT